MKFAKVTVGLREYWSLTYKGKTVLYYTKEAMESAREKIELACLYGIDQRRVHHE